MAQLTLPKNSRFDIGKTWPKPDGAKNLRELRVYRWNPEHGQNPRVDTVLVDTDDLKPRSPMTMISKSRSVAPW